MNILEAIKLMREGKKIAVAGQNAYLCMNFYGDIFVSGYETQYKHIDHQFQLCTAFLEREDYSIASDELIADVKDKIYCI